MDIERRHAAIELRAGDGPMPVLAGLAAPYGRPANLPGFVETIKRGAFTRSLQSSAIDPIATVEHDNRAIIGRRSSGTLTLNESERGLEFRIVPPATTVGRDACELVRGKYLTGCSFSFKVDGEDGESWSQRDGVMTRELRSLTLLEISLVARPAYDGATDVAVALRSLSALTRAYPHRLGALRLFLETTV